MENETKHGWNESQVKSFAKEFANSEMGRAFYAFVPSVREALLTHFIMLKVGLNYRPVPVNEAFALRNDVAMRLTNHHKMKVE